MFEPHIKITKPALALERVQDRDISDLLLQDTGYGRRPYLLIPGCAPAGGIPPGG